MKHFSRTWLLLCVALSLGACGHAEKKPAEPPPVKDTVFGDMVGTMDKARAVEGTVMQQKKDNDKAIEASEKAATESQ